MKISFRKIFECLPSEYVVLKADAPNFTIVAANKMYCKAVGMEREQLIGRGLFEVFPDVNNTQAAIRAVIQTAINTNLQQRPHLVRYDIGNEEKHWNLHYVPVTQEGKVEYIIQLTQDISDLVKMGLKI